MLIGAEQVLNKYLSKFFAIILYYNLTYNLCAYIIKKTTEIHVRYL